MDPIERPDHTGKLVGEHEEDGEVVNEGVGDIHYLHGEDGEYVVHFAPSVEEIGLLQAGGHIAVHVWSAKFAPIAVHAVAPYEEGSDAS